MPNHAAPRIAHSNEQAYPSITNIHSHSNNPNNIQFMPAMAPGNRNIGAVEVLLLIVVIAIAFVLVIDLSGISKSVNHIFMFRIKGLITISNIGIGAPIKCMDSLRRRANGNK